MSENTFTMQSWDEHVVSGPEDGPRVAYAHATFRYQGLIEGTSVDDMLLNYPGGETSSPGYERFDGSVAGRKGTFIVRHEYTFGVSGDEHYVRSEFTVVPGSGTDELAGLSGRGTSSGSSTTMDYTFEPAFGE